MKARLVLWLVSSLSLGLISTSAWAGDSTCYGYKSSTSYFACGEHGNCTWWVASKRPDLAAKRTGSGWNAVQWYGKFKDLGFPVGSSPTVGAVAVFDATDKNPAGHVAYVESVNSDGSFDASEMDYFGSLGGKGLQHGTYYPDGNNTYHRNNSKIGGWTLKGFIYYKESCDPAKERCGIKSNGPIGWYPPVEQCEQASQWFKLYDAESRVSRIEPATKSDCPKACYAN